MTVYERLQTICKANGITITSLCLKATGNKGILSTWKNNKGHMRSDYLSACADILGCSTDYILGRSVPQNTATITGEKNVIQQGNVSNSPVSIGNNMPLSEIETELIGILKKLSLKEKNKLLTYAYELEENI